MPEELYDSYSKLQDEIEITYDKITNFDRLQEILENTIKELKKLEKKKDEQS